MNSVLQWRHVVAALSGCLINTLLQAEKKKTP